LKFLFARIFARSPSDPLAAPKVLGVVQNYLEDGNVLSSGKLLGMSTKRRRRRKRRKAKTGRVAGSGRMQPSWSGLVLALASKSLLAQMV
jgi:hypothetical protein